MAARDRPDAGAWRPHATAADGADAVPVAWPAVGLPGAAVAPDPRGDGDRTPRADDGRPARGPRDGGSRFGVDRIPGAFGLAPVLLGLAVMIGLALVLGTGTLAVPEGVPRTVATLLVQDVAFVAAAIVVALVAAPVALRDVGLRRPPRPVLAVGLIVAAFVAYLTISYGVLVALDATDVEDRNPQGLGITDGILPALVVGGLAATATPIVEELVFRGLLFGGLARTLARISPDAVAIGLAALVSGGLFGLAHAGGTTTVLMAPLAVFGVLLCLLTWATRSILPAIAVHAINNAIAVGEAAEFPPAGTAGMVVGALLVVALVLLAVRAAAGSMDPLDPLGRARPTSP